MSSSPPSLPSPASLEERSFEYRGFKFSSEEGSIAGASELRALSERLGLGAIPLPEMVFARSCIAVAHAASGARLSFSAEGAARAWHARQLRALGRAVDATRFDWSYATDYDGDAEVVGSSDSGGAAARAEPTQLRLPLARLQQRGAILFFAAAPLLGSDLSDRGTAECVVKLRVMEDCFLVLLRCFVRLDRASVWLRDVRFSHVFGEADDAGDPLVLRDVQLREAVLPADLPPAGGVSGGEDCDEGAAVRRRDVLLPGPPPSFFAGAASTTVAAAAAAAPAAAPTAAVASAAATAAVVATVAASSASPPQSPTKIHPVVLESMRARAARSGMAVADDGTLLTSPGGPPAPAPRGGGLPADLVAARFVSREAGGEAVAAVVYGGALRLDCSADEVHDAVAPSVQDTRVMRWR
jgi:type 2A phosphatase activator TIP41